jgi:hypothetical protein
VGTVGIFFVIFFCQFCVQKHTKNGVTHLQRNWGHVGAFFAETEENNLLKKIPNCCFFVTLLISSLWQRQSTGERFLSAEISLEFFFSLSSPEVGVSETEGGNFVQRVPQQKCLMASNWPQTTSVCLAARCEATE